MAWVSFQEIIWQNHTIQHFFLKKHDWHIFKGKKFKVLFSNSLFLLLTLIRFFPLFYPSIRLLEAPGESRGANFSFFNRKSSQTQYEGSKIEEITPGIIVKTTNGSLESPGVGLFKQMPWLNQKSFVTGSKKMQ